MIIGWVADNFYPEIKRGAEIEDNNLINEGIKRGHEIIRMGKLSKNIDLFIVANRVDKHNIGELLSYLSRKPYVNLEHDLRSPMCPWYSIFAKESILNVFHSPLQAELIQKQIGKTEYFLHPMVLTPDYKDLGWQRLPQNEVLYVGDYAKEKGYRNLEAWINSHPDCKIWHVGGGFEESHPRMIEMGESSQRLMPYLYNTFSSLIFLPQFIQACSRVIAEAYLCKIPNIIHNGKDGFSSYGFTPANYETARQMLIDGGKRFWDKVEQRFEEWYKMEIPDSNCDFSKHGELSKW